MIGDYFTGSSRRRLFWIPVFIVFVCSAYIGFYYKIVITQDTLYWVFSSIVQSLVALVALFGVVAIFKLQILYNRERQIIESTFSPNMFLYPELAGKTITSIEELSLEINKILKAGVSEESRVKKFKERIDNLFLSKNLIIDFTIKFSVYTFTIVIFALLFLMSAPLISEYFLGLPILFTVLISIAHLLFLVIKGIAASIKH